MIVAKDNGGGDFKRQLPTPGMHHAVCSKIFDLGMQSETFNGDMAYRHKVHITFEIDETIDDPESEYHGKRLLQNQEYTLSLTEKAKLRGHLESWRGREFTSEELDKGFDIEKLLKVQCQLNVMIKTSKAGNEYAVIKAIVPAGKDAPIMIPELPDDWCPKWIQDKIDTGDGAKGDVATAPDEDDDVPF